MAVSLLFSTKQGMLAWRGSGRAGKHQTMREAWQETGQGQAGAYAAHMTA